MGLLVTNFTYRYIGDYYKYLYEATRLLYVGKCNLLCSLLIINSFMYTSCMEDL